MHSQTRQLYYSLLPELNIDFGNKNEIVLEALPVFFEGAFYEEKSPAVFRRHPLAWKGWKNQNEEILHHEKRLSSAAAFGRLVLFFRDQGALVGTYINQMENIAVLAEPWGLTSHPRIAGHYWKHPDGSETQLVAKQILKLIQDEGRKFAAVVEELAKLTVAVVEPGNFATRFEVPESAKTIRRALGFWG